MFFVNRTFALWSIKIFSIGLLLIITFSLFCNSFKSTETGSSSFPRPPPVGNDLAGQASPFIYLYKSDKLWPVGIKSTEFRDNSACTTATTCNY